MKILEHASSRNILLYINLLNRALEFVNIALELNSDEGPAMERKFNILKDIADAYRLKGNNRPLLTLIILAPGYRLRLFKLN